MDDDTLDDAELDVPQEPVARAEQQLRDYYNGSKGLIWQRQAIFFAATVLTMFYFDAYRSLACYGAVLLTEVIDFAISRRLDAHSRLDERQIRGFRRWILAATALSALSICQFVIIIALQEPSGGHFTPLFFLLSAAIFAAMNNHQIVSALALRLAIYGASFLFISLLDILREAPPMSSDHWLHFFTVLFSMYFIVDCSFVFLKNYRKNLQQMEVLREEHERTKVAYRAKSQFVSVVSHELRTPLTSIKGSLDLINTGILGSVPDQFQSVLRIAGRNAERLGDLINDILDLQKIESGEVAYKFAPMDVRDLIAEAVEANKGFADKTSITLIADIDGREGEIIRGDERRLMQVMANMISNALKFSHEGGKVTVGYSRTGDTVRIAVADQGVGIPENSRDKVFGKFTQVDSTDQRAFGGTGLGMNISKKIVEQHDGRIDYESTVGVGTTFFIDLKAWDQAKAA
ncbi:MAG: HAMP domain-containing histidine kinase [Pseudooceanicola sp.]|nr:HAMP domain-containing histidine kinase [Pseudooceanicola sp.]